MKGTPHQYNIVNMWNSKGASKYSYVSKSTPKQETTSTFTTAPASSPSTSASSDPPHNSAVLHTTGYGGCKAFPEFLVRLKNNNIRLLVDIRIRPACSFSKDFNGPKLCELLGQNGIQYELFTELGNVFKDVDDSSNLYPTSPLLLPHSSKKIQFFYYYYISRAYEHCRRVVDTETERKGGIRQRLHHVCLWRVSLIPSFLFLSSSFLFSS